MGSRLTTFFFIVLLLTPYGLLYFRLLVFIGLCQVQWRGCYLAGISGLVNIIRTFGIWFQGVERGLCGWNVIAFEDNEKTLDELKVLCQRNLLEWSRCWGFTNCSSLSEVMLSLSLVS